MRTIIATPIPTAEILNRAGIDRNARTMYTIRTTNAMNPPRDPLLMTISTNSARENKANSRFHTATPGRRK